MKEKRKKSHDIQEIYLQSGINQFSVFHHQYLMEKWSSHVTASPVYSGFGCSPRSRLRYTAQLRDYRSTNREISFMAGQLFCINLKRLVQSVIQLRFGVQEAYLRKSLHGHLA